MICENHSPREAFPRVAIVFSMVSFFFIASESPKYYRPSSRAHGMHDVSTVGTPTISLAISAVLARERWARDAPV
eukprot:COSAG05_NODE_22151_length_267_cov_0.255952_1_plen_74_part_01